jgi:hypothetical protein
LVDVKQKFIGKKVSLNQNSKENIKMTKETYIVLRDQLKAILKEGAVCQKHNKNAFKNRHRAYQACGWNCDKIKVVNEANPYKQGEIIKDYSDDFITGIHILYNQLRNRPPHTGSVEKDGQFLKTADGIVAQELYNLMLENHQDA